MALIPKRPGQFLPWAANAAGTQAGAPGSPLSVGSTTRDSAVFPPRGIISGDSRLIVPARAPLLASMAYAKRREIVLTAIPIRVAATGAQELRLAQDIQDLDELDVELQVLRLEGSTPSVTIELQTGMQTESSEGWVSLGNFTAVTSAPFSLKRNIVQVLRFVRWNVTAIAGTPSPGATFYICGIGRRWA